MIAKPKAAALLGLSVLAFVLFASRLQLEEDGLSLVEGLDPEAAEVLREFSSLDILLVDLHIPQASVEELEHAARAYTQRLLADSNASVRSVRFEVPREEGRRTFQRLFAHRLGLFEPSDAAGMELGLRAARRDLNSAVSGLLAATVGRDPWNHRAQVQAKLHRLRPSLKLDLSRGSFLSEDKQHILLLVSPNARGLDVRSGRALLRTLRRHAPPKATVEFFGAHAFAAAAADQVRSDVEAAILVSMLAFLCVALVAFRRLRFALAVFAPVAWGALGGLALLGALGLRLHGVTFGFGAILLGIGVDYGVHLGVHYRAFRHAQPELTKTQAMDSAVQHVRSSLFLGMFTTAAAFVVLLGARAAMLEQLVYWSVPALILSWFAARFGLPAAAALFEGPAVKSIKDRHALRAVVVAVFVTTLLASVWGLSRVNFDGNVRNLDPQPSWMRAVEDRFVSRYAPPEHPTLVVVEGPDMETAQYRASRVQTVLQQALDAELVGSVRSVSDFLVTPQEQRRRHSAFRGLQTELSSAAVALDLRPQFFAPYFDEAEEPPIFGEASLADTPLAELLNRHVVRGPGRVQVMTLVTMEGTNATELPADVYDGLVFLGAKVVSAEATARRTVSAIRSDVGRLSLGALLVVALILGVVFRNPRPLLCCLFPVASALLVAAGMQGLLHVSINVASVGAFALLAGVAVDYGIFVTDALVRQEGLPAAKQSVSLAALSTTVGFASLLVAESAVMWTLGLSVSLGVVAAWAAACTVLPAVGGSMKALCPKIGLTVVCVVMLVLLAVVLSSWLSGAQNYGGGQVVLVILLDIAVLGWVWRRAGRPT